MQSEEEERGGETRGMHQRGRENGRDGGGGERRGEEKMPSEMARKGKKKGWTVGGRYGGEGKREKGFMYGDFMNKSCIAQNCRKRIWDS